MPFPSRIDLTTLAADQGFVVRGDTFRDEAGFSVSSAGDVNGDGIDDIIVGAPYGGDGGRYAGEAYVVFGTRAGFGAADGAGRQVIDLTTLTAAQGFVVQGDAMNDRAGHRVSDAGDVNGDGIDDLIVSAPGQTSAGPGEAYVVFGTRDGFGSAVGGRQVVDLSNLTTSQGFVIQGDLDGDMAGYSISSAGDVNGDGVDDMIVGAVQGDDGGLDAGEAYVVFGTRDGFGAVIDLTSLTAAQGFVLQGGSVDDNAGWSVSSAGDVNGDGLDDVIVGAPNSANGISYWGEAYVVFGTRAGFGTDVGGRQVIDFTSLNAAQGFVIQGGGTNPGAAGTAVSNAGDVNGDGIDDLIVGAVYADAAAYVVFGTRSGFGTDAGGRQVLNFANLGASQGFLVRGTTGDGGGKSLSAAGDVNGDGIDDLIVGAPRNDSAGYDAGAAYVVFGTRAGFGTTVAGQQVVELSALTPGQGFVVVGDAAEDVAGTSVSAAGDVDGDGIDDLIVGAPLGNDGGRYAGEAYVIYGQVAAYDPRFPLVVDLTGLAAGDGFIIQGDAGGDRAGWSVASAGDVNGDGLDDLIVGATSGDDGGSDAGEAYVVFGSLTGFGTEVGGRRVIDLTSLAASQGFIVQGDGAGDQAGTVVASAGDVNGDGIDDLIVGAQLGEDGGGDAGEAYIVFGTRGGFGADVGGRQVVDLTTLGAGQGFIIQGDAAFDNLGWGVASAGDLNGDGIDDVIVGARAGDDGGVQAGEAYVVFGTRTGFGADVGGRQVIDLTTLTASQGFVIQGDDGQDYAGMSLSSAGDINGDGIDDVVIGAPTTSSGGEAYVVYGTRDGFGADVGGRQVLDLTWMIPSEGFVIRGAAAGDGAGYSVASAGDFNGDGIDDLIIGARSADGGGLNSGDAYVVFGNVDGFGQIVDGRAILNLATLDPSEGFRIQGDATRDYAGRSVDSAGDVNGDGLDDLIIGAPYGDNGGSDAGQAYVVFGTRAGFSAGGDGRATLDLSALTARQGFIVQGDVGGDRAGWSVAGAGDVDGDGVDDLIVGAWQGDDGGSNAGEAYVIFGRRADPNTPPTLAANQDSFALEGGETVIFQLDYDDAEQPDTKIVYTITAAPTHGVLRLDGVDLGVGDSFTQADIGNSLVRYKHDGNESGANDGFTFTVSDGQGGTVAGQHAFTVMNVNNAPEYSGLDPFTSYVEDGPPLLIDSDVTVSDSELTILDDYAGASLTVARADGASAEDLLDLDLTGASFTIDGGNLQSGGATFATFTSAGGTLTVTFTSSGTAATEALVNDVMQHVTYANSSNTPPSGVQLRYIVSDGNSGGAQGIGPAAASWGHVTIGIVPNDDPAVATDDRFFTDELTVKTGNLFADNFSGADSDPDSASFSVTAVNGSAVVVGSQIQLASGALLTVNANGNFIYDPNGRFEYLPGSASGASNMIGTDSFTYSLGGNTATVTIDITGLDNNDVAEGSPGNDMLDGGVDTNTMSYANAGAGVRVALIAGPQDTIGAGIDTLANFVNLTGSDYVDELRGSAGANVLDGGLGADVMLGGNGDDIYVVDNAGDSIREAAEQGTDTVRASVSYALPDREVERLVLTGSGDLSGGGNRFDNVLTGNSGANSLAGYGGEDRIDGGAGADLMAGGVGDDTYVVDNAGDRIKEALDEGTDTVETSVDYTLPGTHIERIIVTGGNAINVTGNGFDNVLLGNGAANSLYGAGGDDRIDGGGGADVMAGGLGDDIFVVDDLRDRVKERANEGIDTIETRFSFSLQGLEVEKLTLTHADSVDGTGNALDNVLTGNESANALLGYEGADHLIGGDGNDVLRGMAGNDVMEGGEGADSFYFDATLDGASNVDMIADYEAGHDGIYLRRAKFDGMALGALSADAFAVGSEAGDASDRILYDSATGALYFDPDGTGTAAAVQFASLDPGLSLTHADFIVF